MKPSFKLKIQAGAFEDIQEGVNYYNSRQKGLGKRFFQEIRISFSKLKKNPFFQLRYDDVRCLPLKKFPFMVHFTVDEINKIVTIYAVINSHLDPAANWIKKE